MAETQKLTLGGFLLARVAETEAHHAPLATKEASPFPHFHRRVVADCAAKRAIVERCERAGDNPLGRGVLKMLAAVYADHPDYDEAKLG